MTPRVHVLRHVPGEGGRVSDDYPCQGPSPDCTGGGASVPFGLCDLCRAERDRRAVVLDLGPALRDRRAPWHRLGELADVRRAGCV